MRLKLLTLILILASSPAHAAAQGQDQERDKYRPRTLSQIIKANSQRVAEMKVGKYSLFNADGLPSRVTVTYTGKSRKIATKKKEFISELGRLVAPGRELADLFNEELLFVEDSVEYWLPVHNQLVPHFKQSVKKGEKVTLLLLWIGASKESEKIEWFFLVNQSERP